MERLHKLPTPSLASRFATYSLKRVIEAILSTQLFNVLVESDRFDILREDVGLILGPRNVLEHKQSLLFQLAQPFRVAQSVEQPCLRCKVLGSIPGPDAALRSVVL